MKIKKIIIKAKLFPDSSTPLTLGARQLLLRSKNELFSPFFPDCSVIAKSLAHLRLSWLYLIYLIAKCISFLQKKDESSKIFLNHNAWLWSSVCSIAQLVSGWHGFESRPSLDLFFTVNFSAIDKTAAHLRGSCLNLILIHNSKETSLQIYIEKSRRKMSLRFDNKMFLNVLLYALKKISEGQWSEYNWSKY